MSTTTLRPGIGRRLLEWADAHPLTVRVYTPLVVTITLVLELVTAGR